jgi:diguanylate cyclase (GGDEF)-like protein
MVRMNDFKAYTILRNLLTETAPYSGQAFLQAAARAFAQQFSADFVFITKAIDKQKVQMLASWRDGKEISGWEFDLPGTPCDLIYRDEVSDSWASMRVGRMVAIADDVRHRFASTKDTNYEAFIGFPLWDSRQTMIGHVALFFKRPLPIEPERKFMLELVELFSYKVQAELNRMVLEQVRENMLTELKRANEQLARDSITDSLTQVYNRRYFTQRMQQAFARYKRSGEQYALMLLDLDHFKRINDKYGHDAGDKVLRQAAETFLKSTRADVEMAFRIGGEEFAILCHGAKNAESLNGLGERINRAVRDLLVIDQDQQIHVTVSIGAALPKKDDSSWNAIYVRADAALYLAKSQGRDKTIVEP